MAEPGPRAEVADTRRRAALQPLVVALMAIAPFLPALSGGFVWDDHNQLERNERLSLSAIPSLFRDGESATLGVGRGERWNPLGWSLLALQRGVSTDAWVFHAGSLALHGLASALLFAALRQLVPVRAALIGTALYAWMPAQGEVAGWPAAQFESQTAVLLLLGLLLGLRGAAIAGALMASASLLCKEAALPLIPVVVALPAALGRVPRRRGAIAGAAAIAAWFVARSLLPGGLPGADVDPGRAFACWARLLRIALMSAESSLLRPIPLRAEASDVAAVSALLGGMAFGALRLRRDWTAGVLLVAGALACAAGVTLNAVGAARWELLPDRYASLGLIGVGLAAGGAFATVPMLRRRAASFAVGALLLSLAVRDAAEARRWRDDISLFSWEFSVWPDQPQAAFYLAHALAEAGRWGDALPRAEDAVRLGPDLPQTWEVLAVVRHGLGDRDGARAVLQEGLSRLPGDARLQEAMARWEAAR